MCWKADITLQTKVSIVKATSSQWSRRLWELDCSEGRMPKNECLWAVVLEKTPESSLDSKEIKPVNLKGNQAWIFIGRTRTEVEVLVCWSSNENSWLIGKVPAEGRRGTSKDEMARWYPLMQRRWTWANVLEMVRDREVWHAAVHRVAKSWTQPGSWTTNTYSDHHSTFHLLLHTTIVWVRKERSHISVSILLLLKNEIGLLKCLSNRYLD